MVGQWKEGDLVRLKSGGPQMVVDRVIRYSTTACQFVAFGSRTTKNKNLASRLAVQKSAAHRTNSLAEGESLGLDPGTMAKV